MRFFKLFGGRIEQQSDDLDDGDDTGSHGNAANVVEVCALDAIRKFSWHVAIGRAGVEVVSGGSRNHDHSAAEVEESHQPQDTEDHEPGSIGVFIGPCHESSLGDFVTGKDLIGGAQEHVGADPGGDNDELDEEMDYGHDYHSLVVSEEVGGRINDVDGELQ